MLGFLSFGTALAFLDLSCKAQIEAQEQEKFPRELEGTKGKIRLYRNHNAGFSFGFLKEFPRAVELIPLCVTSGLAGMWLYVCGLKGQFIKKLALTFTLAGAASNLYDRLRRGYVVDYFSIQWKFLKKIVFNLGDLFILKGACLLILSEIVETVRENMR